MNGKMILACAVGALALAACSKTAPAGNGSGNATASNTTAAAPAANAAANATAPANAMAATQPTPDYSDEALVGSWLDDDKDVTVFAADGTFSVIGKPVKGTWKPDGKDRYDIDTMLGEKKMQGIMCVDGDTMVMNLMGDVNYFGRYGEDGNAAEPDKNVTCE